MLSLIPPSFSAYSILSKLRTLYCDGFSLITKDSGIGKSKLRKNLDFLREAILIKHVSVTCHTIWGCLIVYLIPLFHYHYVLICYLEFSIAVSISANWLYLCTCSPSMIWHVHTWFICDNLLPYEKMHTWFYVR